MSTIALLLALSIGAAAGYVIGHRRGVTHGMGADVVSTSDHHGERR